MDELARFAEEQKILELLDVILSNRGLTFKHGADMDKYLHEISILMDGEKDKETLNFVMLVMHKIYTRRCECNYSWIDDLERATYVAFKCE